MVNTFISVIIPVFNDAEPLKTCLEALENQTYPKDLYEVIVIDNASDENIEGCG
jgi:glycosyltransferase involved in cell wall biosynthesis